MLSGCESLASLPVSTQQRPEFLGRCTKQAVDLDSSSVLSLTNTVSALWQTKQTFLRSHGSRPFNTIEQFGWFITHWKTRPLQGSELAIWEWDAHWRCQHTQVICSLSTWENGTLTVTDSMQTMAMDLRSSWIYIDLRPLRKLKQEKEEAEKDLREAFNIQCLSWSHFLQPVQESSTRDVAQDFVQFLTSYSIINKKATLLRCMSQAHRVENNSKAAGRQGTAGEFLLATSRWRVCQQYVCCFTEGLSEFLCWIAWPSNRWLGTAIDMFY